MSSTVKPVLTPGSQNSVMNQSKPLHPQGPSNTYGQQQGHLAQNLVTLSNNNSNPSHAFSNSMHQTNTFPVNVQSVSHNSSNSPSLPVSVHPASNITHVSTSNQVTKTALSTEENQHDTQHASTQNSSTPDEQNLTIAHTSQSRIEDVASRTHPNGTAENLATGPENNEPVESALDFSPKPSENEEACNSFTAKKSSETIQPESQEEEKVLHELEEPNSSIGDLNSASLPDLSKNESSVDDASNLPQEDSKAVVDSSSCNSSEITNTEAIDIEAKEESHGNTNDVSNSVSPKCDDEDEKLVEAPELEKNVEQPHQEVRVQETAKKSVVQKTSSKRTKTQKHELETTWKQVSPILKTPTGKSTRIRTRTQPYQSPLPEIEIITKISSSAPKSISSNDKLIVFYKNEFLAVRNLEGGFYICQAVQNIYKSSKKRLKIRWLSQDKAEKSGEVYTPDFYDQTDFDCILTNLNMERIDKGKYRLPPSEKERTDSILSRSLAAEKGEVESPSLTEEHPDGLDLSLYKEESQLKKRRGVKRKAASQPLKKHATAQKPKKTPSVQPKPVTLAPKAKKINKREPSRTLRKQDQEQSKSVPSTRSEKKEKKGKIEIPKKSKSSPRVDEKKAKVLAKVVKNAALTSPAKRSRGSLKSGSSSNQPSSKVNVKSTKTTLKTTKRYSRK